MRSTDLLLQFPLSFELIFAPQKIRALEHLTLEQWKMRGMRSIALLFKYMDRFRRYEREAREQNRGLWAKAP